MNGEDSRGNYNFQQRKSNPHKNVYSPNSMYGNPGYTQGQHPQHSHSQHPQPQKRRPQHNKNSYNSNDRLIKQNDQIIKLLKEIRDRLPVVTSSASVDSNDEILQRTNSSQDEDISLTNESGSYEISDNDSADEENSDNDEMEDDTFETNENEKD